MSTKLRHLVNYHNSDGMKVEFDEIENFAIGTNKKIDGLVGDRVWMIGRYSADENFYLYGTFRVETVSTVPDGDFDVRVSAKRGQWIRPAARLDDEPWFPDFKRSMGNFSLGFQTIKDEAAIAGLQRLREEFGVAGESLE